MGVLSLKSTMCKIIMPVILVVLLSTTGYSTTIEKNDEYLLQYSGDIICVDDDGGSDYQKIQDAIDNASDHDIIFVYTGIYNETIIIDKSIKVQGENKNKTIIDGMYKDKVVNILADNVVFTGFTIKNSGGFKENTAVFIQSDNNTISNCVIYRTRTGIIINNSQNQQINNCLFHTNGEGIWSKYSNCLIISNSEFCHNGIALNFYRSNNIVIENVYAHENSLASLINDSSNIEITHCASCDNNDNGGGVFFYNSCNINIENTNAIHSGSGFKIVNSTNINFERCDVKNITHFGIWIYEGSDNININNCNIIDNLRHGVHITEESSCTISNSNLYNNSIESVLPKNSDVVAKNNYWGSTIGPLFSKGFRLIDTLQKDFGKIKFLPWSANKFENAGTDWVVEDVFEKTIVHGYGDSQIIFAGNDTDSDGLPDWWEKEFNYNATEWDDHSNMDLDGDALNSFEECYAYDWGARPNQKDLFLEFDVVETKTPDKDNNPPEEYINQMIARFAEHDIVLHVDQGQLGGGEEIPYINDFGFDKLTELYWDYFLHNDLNNPRKNIFHYGLICSQGPGNGFAFIGWAHLNSFCISADELVGEHSIYERGWLITCGSMHETGHTLGLVADDFGGNDNHAAIKIKYPEFWYFRNYKSCMNYRYTYSILDYSDGDNGKVDYNDWEGMEFDFFKNTHFEWPKD